jgi:two-component system CheB/CheR fusion protein
MEWTEAGENEIDMTEGQGFGTLLVATSARQLGASIERTVEGGKLVQRMELPGSVIAG